MLLKKIYIFFFCKYYILSDTISILYRNDVIGGVILENDTNRKVTREKQTENKKTFISEVQTFEKPEDYDDAFLRYYPEQKQND